MKLSGRVTEGMEWQKDPKRPAVKLDGIKSVKKVTRTLNAEQQRKAAGEQPSTRRHTFVYQSSAGLRCSSPIKTNTKHLKNVHPAVLQQLVRRKIRQLERTGPCLKPLKCLCFFTLFPRVNRTNPVTIPCSSTSTLNCSIPLTRIHQSHTVLEEINRPQPICHQ